MNILQQFGKRFLVTIGSDEAGYVELDCTESETHQRSAEVTEHPVEKGADIADHVKITPGRLSITGIVSDTQPILVGRRDRSANRSIKAFEAIRDMLHSRRVINVYTALQTWNDMVITGISNAVTAQTGDAVQMTIDFQEVIFATTQTTESAPEPKKETPKQTKSLGKKPTAQATDAQSSSFASNLADWIGAP